MRIDRLVLSPFETNCWVVSDDAGGPALVIDPAADAAKIVQAVGSRHVVAVVLTHGHFDHLGAAADLVEATGAPLMVHTADAGAIASANANGGALLGFGASAPVADRLLVDGDAIEVGELRFVVLHTPGHTPGGICLFAQDPSGGAPHLFAGDTLFSGSVGRTDFPGGDGRALLRSIAAKLAPLPEDTIVHPGHGPSTTIGRERRLNPFFPRA